MEREAFLADYDAVLQKNGLNAYLACADAFFTLTERLLAANAQFNLTAITDPHQIILRHYADCLAIASDIPEGARVIDVGCGAGFPSLPLAVARPDLHITALDSTAKKLRFVAECAGELGLTGLTVCNARAEEAAARPDMRELFDVATARAVARLCVLDELCLPFVRVGGLFLALKGENGAAEAAEAAKGVRILGGNAGSCTEIPITDGGEILHHVLFRTEKVASTPEIYPRNYARICKKPL